VTIPFEELGGVDNLVEWAKYNQTEFYKILARLMPREIHADVNAEKKLSLYQNIYFHRSQNIGLS
jgi:hypothetical protein